MLSDILSRNLDILNRKAPHIALHTADAPADMSYTEVRQAKTGELIPLFQTGQAVHSLYNPLREAEKLIGHFTGFMLFCGVGAGIHIESFLNMSEKNYCAVTEATYSSFRQLLSLLDLSHILDHPRLFILPPCTDPAFLSAFTQTYLPVLHGNFQCNMLKPWSLFFSQQTAHLSELITEGLRIIKSDFSVQSHFGKIWTRNILFNAAIAAEITPVYPSILHETTALILGAGPSLEKKLPELKKLRSHYTVFCTDTALPVVLAYGLVPDFFIAVDPQHVSYNHVCGTIPPKITGIFDLCANTAAVRAFRNSGNPFFFTVGGHPLAQYAALLSPFPPLETGSGTVAVSAYHAAQSLGFRHIECTGMDFAYTGGKAYAQGTYLSQAFHRGSNRLHPEETAFTALMFRTETVAVPEDCGYTYRTPILDSYKAAFEKEQNNYRLWKTSDFKTFPYEAFKKQFTARMAESGIVTEPVFLPYRAWLKMHTFHSMELAVERISEYTNAR